MHSIRAGRRYRWRLAGGHLVASEAGLRFTPNRLERWRADTSWECSSSDVVGLQVRGRVWLEVDAAGTVETFRIFGAIAAEQKLNEALQAAAVARV